MGLAAALAGLIGLAIYLAAVRALRFRRLRQIEDELPAPTDLASVHSIVKITSQYEFPFLMTKSLSFALFKSYGIPSVSKLLAHTGELVDRCNRRFDDTALLIAEFFEWPADSPRGLLALERMNFIHSNYNISNDDYLYVLSTFIVEPPVWIARYGYRSLSKNECDALFLYWKDVGIRMGIEGIPDNYDDTVRFMENFERDYMKFARSNAEVAKRTMDLFLSGLPGFLRPVGVNFVAALCDERLRDAVGFPNPPRIYNHVVRWSTDLYKFVQRHLLLPRLCPSRRTPDRPVRIDEAGKAVYIPRYHDYAPIYKNGYKIEELGPPGFPSKHEVTAPQVATGAALTKVDTGTRHGLRARRCPVPR